MYTLMINTGGIGDFLLTFPAIKALSQSGTIHLAGYPDRLQLAVDAGIATTALSLDAIGFDSVFTQPNKRLLQVLRPADKIIVWMEDSDQTIRKNLEAITRANVHVFDPLPPEKFAHHASNYYSQCFGFPSQPPFRWTPKSSTKRLDIVLHPGSGDSKKNWPPENSEDLATQLALKGREITWCIGPAEVERIPHLPSGQLLQSTSLCQLAQELATAQQYIGNDSGITHLAASLDVPTISLFNHTNPSIWAPKGENVTVFHQANHPTEQILKLLNLHQ